MHQSLLQSVPLSELTALSAKETELYNYYVGANIRHPDADRFILNRELRDDDLWFKIWDTGTYNFYALSEVMDYIVCSLNADQPTFDHRRCSSCNQWTNEATHDILDELVCQSCLESKQEAEDIRETEDHLRRPNQP